MTIFIGFFSAEIIVSLADVMCGGSENENLTVSVSRSGARIASNFTLNITVELLSEMNVTGCGPQPSDGKCRDF